MLLGLAAGKIGDLVFYRDGGEQRTRTRVVPKNPRSLAQMEQRVRIANVSATYRLLKGVIADSFTGRPSNQSGYNAFASAAINMSPYMMREAALAGFVVPAPYIVARGTIAPLAYQMVAGGGEGILALDVAGVTEEVLTIAEVSTLLLAAYPQLQQGDNVTFAGIAFKSQQEGENVVGFRGEPAIASLKVDTTDSTPIATIGLQAADGFLQFVVNDSSPIAEAAVIVSRVDEGGILQTSFAAFELSQPAETMYSANRSEDVLNAAVASYGVGESSILRD